MKSNRLLVLFALGAAVLVAATLFAAERQTKTPSPGVVRADSTRTVEPAPVIPVNHLALEALAEIPEEARSRGVQLFKGADVGTVAGPGSIVYYNIRSNAAQLFYHVPGANIPMADDMLLAGTPRELVSLDGVWVYASSGANYNVTMQFWSDNGSGTAPQAPIPGASCTIVGLPPQEIWDAAGSVPCVFGGTPIKLPARVWLMLTFSTTQAGWVIADQAETGFTADFYWKNGLFSFGNSYAGFFGAIFADQQPCGNGIIDPGEQCDDGNANNNDACSNNCTNGCGNGIVNTGEQCDGTNDSFCPGQCRADCTCPSGACCDSSNGVPYCIVGLSLECLQFGGTYAGDGTSCRTAACPGFGSSPRGACGFCPGDNNAVCAVVVGGEAACVRAFFGAVYQGDGTSCNETPEPGDRCPTCGDNQVNGAGEQCDDGNAVDTDGCRNNCTLPMCGDGLINLTPPEACDGAARRTGVVCSDACDAQCTCCGDAVRQAEEPCDGSQFEPSAPSTHGTCRSDCTYCGDGDVQTGEQCDDGNANNNDACTNACTTAVCGDGIVRTGVEACDDGNTVNTDACTNACQNAVCGDGIVRAGVEACDDGNTVNTDACTNACQNAVCGDGIVRAGVEACDDGNTNNNDACSNNCTRGCGNGIVNTGEQCDGASSTACPGLCRADCTCPPPGGACSPDADGDGIQDLPDGVDLLPVYSSDFRNTLTDPDTIGDFFDRGDQTLCASKAPAPYGVRVKSLSGGARPATTNLYCFAAPGTPDTKIANVNAGGCVTLTCKPGPLAEVLNSCPGGMANAADAGDESPAVAAAGDVTVELLDDGVVIATLTLPQGDSITYDPQTLEVTAPSSNSGTLTLMTAGGERPLPPGQTVVLRSTPLPTVSEWGALMLALALLTGIGVKFRRRAGRS